MDGCAQQWLPLYRYRKKLYATQPSPQSLEIARQKWKRDSSNRRIPAIVDPQSAALSYCYNLSFMPRILLP